MKAYFPKADIGQHLDTTICSKFDLYFYKIP